MGTVPGIPRPTTRAQRLRRDATPAERRLWTALSASQLGVRFNRQMPVGPYIVDFLSRRAMLAVELDGDSHTATVKCDAHREAFIKSRGIRVLRFTNADVMRNLEGVVTAIRSALAERPTPNPSRKREGNAPSSPLPPAQGDPSSSPLPLAGGVGGGPETSEGGPEKFDQPTAAAPQSPSRLRQSPAMGMRDTR